jgi:MinD-like ATPase involved in chromosome partitioning or flagellar assembly
VTVTIAAISGKGGSGKTTTGINLACALAGRDKRVLADASSSDAARAYRDLPVKCSNG